jgi:outer membrane lipoprotein-sorting protein
MRPAENMEKLIRNVPINTSARRDREVFDDVLNALDKSHNTQSAARQSNIWSIIMKSQTTKLATAAVTIVAVVVSITILNKSATPAWAIEQTIKAIEEFRGFYSSGVTVDEYGKEYEAEFWARPNKDGTGSGDFRMETEGGQVIVVNEHQNVTYKYDPNQNVVLVESGNRFYCRPWINGEFFRKMKNFCTDWQEEYGEDESTGRDCVFVTARNLEDNQSYKFQFDLATKLPVRGTVWQNSDFKGKPNIDADEIVYNPKLPEGVFDFEIPNAATVIDRTKD